MIYCIVTTSVIFQIFWSLVRTCGSEDTKQVWKQMNEKLFKSKKYISLYNTQQIDERIKIFVFNNKIFLLTFTLYLISFIFWNLVENCPNPDVDIKDEKQEEDASLAQVIANADNPPKSDKDMAKMIRLPNKS